MYNELPYLLILEDDKDVQILFQKKIIIKFYNDEEIYSIKL